MKPQLPFPLRPIFDPDKQLGAIDVGNTPTGTPSYSCPVVDTLTFASGQLDGVAISGTHAFVTDSNNDSVYAIDISDPENLTLVDTVDQATDGSLNGPEGIAISGNYAYVCAANGLTSIDISNPAAMSVVDNVVVGTGSDYVAISGTWAFVTNSGNDTIISVDISNPAALATSDFHQDNTDLNNCQGLAISGNYAFVSCVTSDALTSVDISNPAAMTTADTVSVADTADTYHVVIVGNFAYLTTFTGANDFITAIDISTPTAMVYNDSWSDAAFVNLRGLVAVGTDLYVCSYGNDRIYKAPTGAGSPGSPGYDTTNHVTDATNLNTPLSIAADGSFLFVGTADGRFSSIWVDCFT